MKLTRKQVLAGAAGAALGAAGVYELVDQLAGAPERTAVAAPRQPEQHLLSGVREVTDNGVEVLVPPLHHQIATARVKVDAAQIGDAKQALERVLAGLDSDYAATPAGLGVTLAWGLPYFDRYVPGPVVFSGGRPSVPPSETNPSPKSLMRPTTNAFSTAEVTVASVPPSFMHVVSEAAHAWRLAFAREPTPKEEAFAVDFVAKHGLTQFCLVLLNTNEFLYVD